ncbi:MAG: DUF4294 domain-containing protein [Saprospiraceae bacterium]|nr:DUF4294 domain-containing protein [Saprospiraceae bacterium]
MVRGVAILSMVFWSFCCLLAQEEPEILENLEINGQIVTAIITEDDTLYIAELENVSVTSPRQFSNRKEYLTYMRYRRYANEVYPYAVEAIKTFRDLEENTVGMKRAKRRRYARKLQKELKQNFEDPLRKLTKTQGRILVHMIEKELETPMYYLIKSLRGGLSARYWDTSGRLFGYHLRRGYIRGEDPIMDMVLDDFNISYEF